MGTGRITDPVDRESFKNLIRAKLGEPVIQLNITEFQADIAVDEALQYFRDYHYNGSTHVYYVHSITQTDIDNRWFDVPRDLIGVTDIYDSTSNSGMGLNTSIYSGAWQVNYDLLFNQGTLTGSFLSFYMNKTYYDMINFLLTGMKSIRFNMLENRVYLDSNWQNYNVGDILILDGHQILDPDANPNIWSDRWLIRYATAKLKRQWGENLGKFSATLPGGITVNAQDIKREADEEIKNIEENCLRDYSEPPRDRIG